jgi:hypothetical protein
MAAKAKKNKNSVKKTKHAPVDKPVKNLIASCAKMTILNNFHQNTALRQ